MTETFTIKQKILLRFQQTEEGLFLVTGQQSNGMTLSLDSLVSQLFFTDEKTFYGLLVDRTDDALLVRTDQLFNVFPESHPYISFEGCTDSDNAILQSIRQAAETWRKPELWQYAEWDENGLQFAAEKMGLSEEAGRFIRQAVIGKLSDSAIRPEQLHALLPHLRKYGWPGETVSTMPLRLAFRLTEPEMDEDSEWLLESIIIGERGRHWSPSVRNVHATIVDALPQKWKPYAEEIEQKQMEMVSFLQSVESGTHPSFLSQTLTDPEVRLFIQEDLPVLQSFGYPVVLPAWLKSITESTTRVRTSASVQTYQSTTGLDEVLAFDWNFSLAGQKIDADSFRKLVDENREYIRSGDEWFHIDPQWLKKIREIMDRADAGEWTVKDLLFQEIPEEILSVTEEDTEDDPLVDFQMQQSLRRYIEKVADKKGLPETPISDELQASLRPYQVEGYHWLVFMRENQFGACLADDMGLGKTVQLITYLLHVHKEQKAKLPSLIICPTSVLGNWQKEIERFAPTLSVMTHYGPNRMKDESLTGQINREKPDVILTTYGTATQDGELLAQYEFSSITLDEAQNIKNMQTKQSRSIRKFRGQHHIALTGTPIENRLSELWAIFDFIHKGYFGSFRKFANDFIIPIERDDSERDKRKLRTKIQPFLLRRTKSDPELQLNLPKKLEQNEYCPLTTEQAALYESFLEETKFKLQTLTGFEKKGLILKMLSRLKQLCNHPALFLKEPQSPVEDLLDRSDKLKRIVSMASEVVENGEQCIIFTQYIGMGHLIRQCLSDLFDIEAPFLTGSMPKGQRDQLVEAFQAGEFPVFILSLRAGGTGLNLTAANHVLHADRWWNPAVENQATDRAYRIGQTKFVHVHKFVTIGTIEEKIDKMLEHKASLSADLIHSNQWITELSDQELDELLSFN